MIYIEFSKRKCDEKDFIHDSSETECKLIVKLAAGDLDLIMDELFYETNYSDISLVLLNNLEKILTELEVFCPMRMLDYIVNKLLLSEHGFIEVDDRFLDK